MDHSKETLLIKDLDSGVYVDQHYLASLQTPPLSQNHWEVFWYENALTRGNNSMIRTRLSARLLRVTTKPRFAACSHPTTSSRSTST